MALSSSLASPALLPGLACQKTQLLPMNHAPGLLPGYNAPSFGSSSGDLGAKVSYGNAPAQPNLEGVNSFGVLATHLAAGVQQHVYGLNVGQRLDIQG